MKNQEQNLKTLSNKNDFNTSFLNIFNRIVTIEQQLDTLRQLLNQQIAFNLKDLYVLVAATSSNVNYKHILNFLKEEKQNQFSSAIQNFIKFYNKNTSLSLSFSQFSSVFLNRQNRLLMKMTLQRDSIGTLPNYILNFSKKILSKEIQLHSQLINFRKNWSNQILKLIQIFFNREENFNLPRFKQFICQVSVKVPERINIQFDIFLRYVNPFSPGTIEKKCFQNIFINSNIETITEFIKEKSKKKNTKLGIKSSSVDKIKNFTDPFIRSEFHDCLARPKITDMFSYREVKSIQKHLDRLNQNSCINKDQISIKLKKFQSIIQKNCQRVLEATKDIIWLEKQIQYSRIELNLCPDFYPVLFFECFHKDKQNKIIPSAMEIYFKQFGINIPLNQIYLLFKRYAWHLQGKMDFNAFCSMFDVCEAAYTQIEKNRQIKSLSDVEIQTKKNFLILLATIIKNQKKIDSIKFKLQKFKQMDLRDVFACFDTDNDGYLSITDFRVVWKKYYNLQISKQMIKILWFRMGYGNQNQIIRYQQFIKQMIPKASSINIGQERKLKKIKSQNTLLKFTTKQNTKKIK